MPAALAEILISRIGLPDRKPRRFGKNKLNLKVKLRKLKGLRKFKVRLPRKHQNRYLHEFRSSFWFYSFP